MKSPQNKVIEMLPANKQGVIYGSVEDVIGGILSRVSDAVGVLRAKQKSLETYEKTGNYNITGTLLDYYV